MKIGPGGCYNRIGVIIVIELLRPPILTCFFGGLECIFGLFTMSLCHRMSLWVSCNSSHHHFMSSLGPGSYDLPNLIDTLKNQVFLKNQKKQTFSKTSFLDFLDMCGHRDPPKLGSKKIFHHENAILLSRTVPK